MSDRRPREVCRDQALPAAPPAPSPPRPTGRKPGRKPGAFTLFSQHHTARTWRSLLIIVCTELAGRHRPDFAASATAVRGRKRQYIAPTSQGMISPAPIPGTNLWVETNLSAKDIIRLAQRLLAACGHSPNQLQLSWAPQSELPGATFTLAQTT